MNILATTPLDKEIEEVRKHYQSTEAPERLLGKYTGKGFSSQLLHLEIGELDGRKDNMEIYGQDFERCKRYGIREYDPREGYTLQVPEGAEYPEMVYDLLQIVKRYENTEEVTREQTGYEVVLHCGQANIRYREKGEKK